MPLVDPSIQNALISKIKELVPKGDTIDFRFYLKYLKFAQKFLYQNYSTIEASILFNKLIQNKKNSQFFKEIFGCETPNNNNPKIKEINYGALYKKMRNSNNKKRHSKDIKGNSYIFGDKFQMKFFQPQIFFQNVHSWFFSDTPVAILCIDFNQLKEKESEKIEFCIILETLLMAASGFTLALCININIGKMNFLKDLININLFAEIHCNIADGSISDYIFKAFNDEQFEEAFKKNKGYIYIYSKFVKEKKFDKLQENEHIKIFQFSRNPQDCFKKLKINDEIQPFPYCEHGFNDAKLRVILSNVPLYDAKLRVILSNVPLYDAKLRVSDIPTSASDLSLCYIQQEKFLNWQKKQINVLLEKDDKLVEIYVKYKDLHNINRELCVEDTLFLSDIDNTMYDAVNEIFSSKFKKSSKYKDFNSFLPFISDYCSFMSKTKPDFMIRKTQIYAIIEAVNYFITKNDQSGQNGMIFQVETGEGKSCIINIIAAIIAKTKKKTVHIASSNIKLSNRDYLESFEYFKQKSLKSSVLLHENELPDVINDKDVPEFFDKKVFENSSRMNFISCGLNDDNKIVKNKANIVFSTFVNFECFYLKLVEMAPGYIKDYFDNAILIIDEADSVLIDEITNGTIISHRMRSNAKPILKFVYDQYMKRESIDATYKILENKHPMCSDLELKHVRQMYSEISLIQDPNFAKKYQVKEFKVKNKSRVSQLFKKTSKKIFTKCDEIVNKILLIDKNDNNNNNNSNNNNNNNNNRRTNNSNNDFDNGSDEDDDDDYDNEYDDESIIDENHQQYANKEFVFRRIVPFDYENKGMMEPNKVFSGFIPQFIAIKEAKENNYDNMIINNIAMNYLYISHPIFVQLYSKICGFTGTLGDEADKELYRKEYKLNTKEIPRHKPNLRVEFPTILCKSVREKCDKIVSEILAFNEKKHPVLVIFQDLRELDDVGYLLGEKGQFEFDVFNGKDSKKITPENFSGQNSRITLGTNVCGRGIDIKLFSYPLHVIVAYHSTNVRLMSQAYGRTARQGQKGTFRVICLEEEYFVQREPIQTDIINTDIKDFQIKNELQNDFISHFQKNYSWIFSQRTTIPTLSSDQIQTLRKVKINVNRIVAYLFKFPICMTVDTFLIIQAQKIFSIYNCPNSIYTWRLFQKYIREMILESWTLMLDDFDVNNASIRGTQEYKDGLIIKKEELITKLNNFICTEKESQPNVHMLKTFMKIVEKVVNENKEKAFKKVPTFGDVKKFLLIDVTNEDKRYYVEFGKEGYIMFNFGFRPMSLYNGSGVRFSSSGDFNYIVDPEIKYDRRREGIWYSITEAIDPAVDFVCNMLSGLISKYVFLKFTLRRTLAGCEFGVCLNFYSLFFNDDNDENYNSLIDTNPLLCFTITVKSFKVVLSGILVLLLIFASVLVAKFINKLKSGSMVITKESVKKIITFAKDKATPILIQTSLDKGIEFLQYCLDKQIGQLEKRDCHAVEIIKKLIEIFSPNSDNPLSKKIFESVYNFIHSKINLGENVDKDSVLKIEFLLLCNIAVFFFNFKIRLQLRDEARNVMRVASQIDNRNTDENIVQLANSMWEMQISRERQSQNPANEFSWEEINDLQ